MNKITLHGFAPSTYTRTACMAAIEKGLTYELAPIAYGKPEHFALHPFGKMPVLTEGKSTIFETLAIVTYLDCKSSTPSLFGVSSPERIDILSAVSVAIDYAYRSVVQIELVGGGLSDDQISAAARVFDWLEKRLIKTGHIASKQLSAADLFFAPMLAYHAQQFGEERAYKNRAHLKSWMASIEKRPSFLETVK